MATSSAQSDTGDSPQTCCSTCRTVFQVSQELLASADTRVRCGECYEIFDARNNLVGETGGEDSERTPAGPTAVPSSTARASTGQVASLAGLANDTSALDVTYSDFDLFSEDAELPEVAYFDQTHDTPEFDFDSVELDDDETFSDTLFVNDVTLDARTGDHTPLGASIASADPSVPPPIESALAREVDIATDTPRVPLEFHYRDPEPDTDGATDRLDSSEAVGGPDAPDRVSARDSPADEDADEDADTGTAERAVEPLLFETPTARRSILLPVVLLLAFAILLAGLYGYQRRDRLADDPFTRPVYELYCRATGCSVPPRSALDRIELLRRNVYSHPDIDDALVIDVSFRNNAQFEQAWPALVVRLSDPSGRLVARRAFEPDEYLSRGQDSDVIAGGAREDLTLDVNDPGQNASSFEVDFVPARAPDASQ